MSPPGRPKGEFRSAHHEATPVGRRPRLALTRAAPLLAGVWLTACQAPVPPTQTEIVRGQLAEILSAQVPGCDTVSLYRRHDRFDYLVHCASGQAYRVRLGADGRVRVTQATTP